MPFPNEDPPVPGFATDRSIGSILAAPRYVPAVPWRYAKLYDELRAVGVWFDYAGPDGFVFAPDPDQATVLTLVEAVVAVHTPDLTPAEAAAATATTEQNEAKGDLGGRIVQARLALLDQVADDDSALTTLTTALAGIDSVTTVAVLRGHVKGLLTITKLLVQHDKQRAQVLGPLLRFVKTQLPPD